MDTESISLENEKFSSDQLFSQSIHVEQTLVALQPSASSLTHSRAVGDSALSMPALSVLGAAILLVLVFFFARKQKSLSSGSSIILVGPSDAGKTAIHSTLVFQQALPSHTTLQANVSLINFPSPEKGKSRTMRLIDVPGHPRVRDQFKDYLPEAKAVVFVVDASTIARNGADVAEHLHLVLHALTSLPPSHTPPPLLILAHKSDVLPSSSSTSSTALAVSRVRTILERELEKRRVSQTGGVGVAQLGEDEDIDVLGGLECSGMGLHGFRFVDWEGGEVKILGSFVKVTRGESNTEKAPVTEHALEGLVEFAEWIQALP